jgi:hypothetical protein
MTTADNLAEFYRQRIAALEGAITAARWDVERAQFALQRFELMLERARQGLAACRAVRAEGHK